MNYALSLVTPPSGEPVSLDEAKAWVKVDRQDEDDLIFGLIKDARQQFDGKDAWFGRALLTQTWDLSLPGFPCEPDRPDDSAPGIRVPLAPLQAVTTISYIDTAGVAQVLAPTEYVVDTKSEPGRVVPAYGSIWPSTRATVNAVTVRFVAGYGTSSDVPAAIKTWLKQVVAYRYRNREAGVLFGVTGITGQELPDSFFRAMASYKVSWNF